MKQRLRAVLLAGLSFLAATQGAPASVSPAGARAYVTGTAAGHVVVIDLATRQVIGNPILVGTNPRGIAVSQDEATVYVANSGSGTLSVISTATNTVTDTVTLTPGTPTDVVVTPDGTKAYVSLGATSAVSVVDTQTKAETGTIPILPGAEPGALALTPDGSKMYVATTLGKVGVVTTSTGNVVYVDVGMAAPRGLAVSPSGDKVFVVGDGAPRIIVTATNAVVPVGADRGTQQDVAIAGTLAFVSNSPTAASAAGKRGAKSLPIDGDAAIDVYDLATDAYVDSFSLGQGEFGTLQVPSIAVTPDGSCGFVVCSGAKIASLQPLDLGAKAESGAEIPTGFDDPLDVVLVGASAPVPDVSRYLLPRSLKLKLAGDGKDALVVTGFFDDFGTAADYTQPVTLTVGGLSRGVSLARGKAGTWSFKDAGTKFSVQPNLKGSSRGLFTLQLSKESLTGKIPASGDVDVSFTAAGMGTATGRIHVANSGYKLGKVRGTLIEPGFFPVKATIAANSVTPDTVALTAGFATNGTTPSGMGPVRLAIGTAFVQSIAGDDFTRSGDRFTYATKDGARRFSLVFDFAREVVTVKAKGYEVGPLAGPTTDLVLDAGTGLGPLRMRVRLASSGSKRKY